MPTETRFAIGIEPEAKNNKQIRLFRLIDRFNRKNPFLTVKIMENLFDFMIGEREITVNHFESLSGISLLNRFLLSMEQDLIYLITICNITSVEFFKLYKKLSFEFIDICMENTNECVDYKVDAETNEVFITKRKEGALNRWAKRMKYMVNIFNDRIELIDEYNKKNKKGLYHSYQIPGLFHLKDNIKKENLDSNFIPKSRFLVWEEIKNTYAIKNPYGE
jgi:hypothetical protein